MAHKKQTLDQAGNAAPSKKNAVKDAESTPKPESTSEYEGTATRKPADQASTEVKTESSSSSGE